jgi:hypothetical protein
MAHGTWSVIAVQKEHMGGKTLVRTGESFSSHNATLGSVIGHYLAPFWVCALSADGFFSNKHVTRHRPSTSFLFLFFGHDKRPLSIVIRHSVNE